MKQTQPKWSQATPDDYPSLKESLGLRKKRKTPARMLDRATQAPGKKLGPGGKMPIKKLRGME